MMVCISVYGIVDGFFVSNFVGELQFAALNLIFPLIMILGSVGFMLGTGGNALVSKTLGEKNPTRANRIFSMLVYTTVVLGVLLSVLGIIFAKDVAKLFAISETSLSPAEKEELIDYCAQYARVILAALPAFMLQNAFQGFFVTAEKPRLGLYVTMTAGFANILFDALFVAALDWGLLGAAVATALSQCIGGVLPVFYFTRKNDSLLQLGKTNFEMETLIKVCTNGMSELMTNVSLSVVSILYNAQLMKIVGIAGVSAYGIIQYVGFIFIGVFIGYSVGSAPIIGYHYGAENSAELKNIYKKSLIVTSVLGAVMTLLACAFARVLASVFVSYDEALLDLTTKGLRIYALGFIPCGINIFASAFFTALNNGGISLLISFSRTFLLQIIAVLVLPVFFALNGVWFSLVSAEAVALFLTAALFLLERKRYHYA